MASWLFALGLAILFVVGTWCGIRLRSEYGSGGKPTLPTVALVWAFYGIHFSLVATAAVESTWPIPLPKTVSIAGGLLLMGLGGWIYLSAVSAFRSMRRLSGLDTTALITNGMYRYSRNPQTVGWMLVLLGAAVLSASGMVLLLGALFWISFRLYLPLEEALLERLHGRAYRAYRARTRRYLGVQRQGTVRDDEP